MLVLKRKEGQWTRAVCKCGNAYRWRVYSIRKDPRGQGSVEVAFDDPARNFRFEREERGAVAT